MAASLNPPPAFGWLIASLTAAREKKIRARYESRLMEVTGVEMRATATASGSLVTCMK
jgi:hypothetical protein